MHLHDIVLGYNEDQQAPVDGHVLFEELTAFSPAPSDASSATDNNVNTENLIEEMEVFLSQHEDSGIDR